MKNFGQGSLGENRGPARGKRVGSGGGGGREGEVGRLPVFPRGGATIG